MTNMDPKSTKTITINGKTFSYCSLKDIPEGTVNHLPFSIRILLENVLRNYDGFSITDEHINTLLNWTPQSVDKNIPFIPACILMQYFTGAPVCVVMAIHRA